MEQLINEEVELFIDYIKNTKMEPFDCNNKFNLPILNALWRIAVGNRFDYHDETLKSIVERFTLLLKRAGKPESAAIVMFPWIVKIYPKFLERDQDLEVNHEVINIIKENIREHEDTLDVNDPRDFTDKVLIEIKKTTDPDSSYYGEKGRLNLINTLADLFLAGSETTSTTLTWAVLYMAR